MAELEALQEAGLSEAEARIYIALLEAGSTTAGTVIKKVGFHRGTTYQLLQRMKEKGLLSSVIKGKKQYFEPVKPERLLDVLLEREQKLRLALPRLNALLAASKEKQEVEVYVGVKGIRSVLDRMLHELGRGGKYFDFGVSGMLRQVMGPYWHTFQRTKRERKITSYVIFNEEIKKNEQFLKEYYGKCRFHPKEYASITDTFIYRDTVVLVIWTAKPPLAVVIKNAENAKSYLNQFRMMWKMAKKN